jgi:hypothetical protein
VACWRRRPPDVRQATARRKSRFKYQKSGDKKCKILSIIKDMYGCLLTLTLSPRTLWVSCCTSLSQKLISSRMLSCISASFISLNCSLSSVTSAVTNKIPYSQIGVSCSGKFAVVVVLTAVLRFKWKLTHRMADMPLLALSPLADLLPAKSICSKCGCMFGGIVATVDCFEQRK